MKKLLTLLITLFAVSAFSQINCGNPNDSSASEAARQQQLAEIKNRPNFAARDINSTTYIAVKMHLFGDDDGTGYANGNEVNNALARLNAEFQPFNVEFYFSGTEFNYYPSTYFNQGEQTGDENYDFHILNGVNDAMNVYVAESVVLGTTQVGGWSYVAPTSQDYNRMFIVTGQLDDFKTSPHEFGHYFGLSHTFNDSDSDDISWRELVTRNFNELPPRLSANCDTNGDYVCDTPSDPYNLPEYDEEDCVYLGTDLDANNDVFSPDVYNFMGYNWCGPQHFSQGQFDRMSDGLLIVTSTFNDFSLNAPETIQPAPSNLVATNTNGDYYGAVTLSWTDNSNLETGFIIERSASASGPFTAVMGVAANVTSATEVPAEANQTYYLRVKPSNGKSNYSPVSNAITTPGLCGNVYGQTCVLNADPVDAAYRIESFKLLRNATVLINNAASGCSENGIGNYYHTLSATVNSPDTLNAEVKSKANNDTGSAYNIIVGFYADWNNDGDFDDSSETLSSYGPSFNQVNGTFNIPSGLANGDYRLRVVLTADDAFTPCGGYFGEVEDYKLTVNTLANPQWDSNAFSIAPNPATTILEIRSNNIPKRIVVTDMTGKIVLNQTTDTKRANVAKLASGMYIIQVYNGDTIFQAKFVKQ